MNLKIRLKIMVCTCNKIQFLTHQLAKDAGRFADTQNTKKGQVRRMRVYKCPNSNFYHLASWRRNKTPEQKAAEKSQKFVEKETNFFLSKKEKKKNLGVRKFRGFKNK